MFKPKEKITQYALLVVALVLSRIVPHPANFTPLSAAALWSGSAVNTREAMIVILASMVAADLFLGFDSLPSRLTVYGSLLLTVLIGKVILKKPSVTRVFAAAGAASISFFVITNFSVWLFSDMYQKTLVGLLNCYVMAIPFLRNSALADLVFSGMFVGGWAIIKKVNSYQLAVNSK